MYLYQRRYRCAFYYHHPQSPGKSPSRDYAEPRNLLSALYPCPKLIKDLFNRSGPATQTRQGRLTIRRVAALNEEHGHQHTTRKSSGLLIKSNPSQFFPLPHLHRFLLNLNYGFTPKNWGDELTATGASNWFHILTTRFSPLPALRSRRGVFPIGDEKAESSVHFLHRRHADAILIASATIRENSQMTCKWLSSIGAWNKHPDCIAQSSSVRIDLVLWINTRYNGDTSRWYLSGRVIGSKRVWIAIY